MTMNTNHTSTIPSVAVAPLMEETTRITELQSELAKITAAQEARAKEAAEKRLETVRNLPQALGVSSHDEVIALIKSVQSPGRKATAVSSAKGKRTRAHISPETRASIIEDAQNESASIVAKRYGVSIPSVYAIKAKAKNGVTTSPKIKKAHRLISKRKSGGSRARIPDAKRRRIMAAVIAPKKSFSELSKKFGVSRQTLYAIKNEVLNGKPVAA